MYMYKYLSICTHSPFDLGGEHKDAVIWLALEVLHPRPGAVIPTLGLVQLNSQPVPAQKASPCINRIHWKVALDPGLPRLLVT